MCAAQGDSEVCGTAIESPIDVALKFELVKDARLLCSVCADLRISSIVDVPNWVVSFYFPRIVLE